MKIIDLLNKIAKGERLPEKIKYKDRVYYLSTYKNGKFHNYFDEDGGYALGYNHLLITCLNDEFEIIEEQQDIDIQAIEEISISSYKGFVETCRYIETKGNELIKAIKQLDRKIREEK